MDYVLRTNNLSKYYGRFQALDGLSMNVPKGAIYGFVGKNGAGKTTLIRLICGLQSPTGGSYTLIDKESGDRDIARARRRIGAVVETPAVYNDMTAAENIRQQYRILGLPSYEGVEELLGLVGLGDTGRKKAKNFSLDELSRLATHYGFIDNGRMVREMTAQELEAACRKCVRMEVSDTKALARVLERNEMEYRILSETEADVFAKPNISRLSVELLEENCEIISCKEQDESLESYYINLVGVTNSLDRRAEFA